MNRYNFRTRFSFLRPGEELPMLPPQCPDTTPESFSQQALRRLPLADAVLSLWSYVLQPPFLDDIFQHYRGRSFEHVLSFPTFVDLLADALIRHDGSGRKACEYADEQHLLPVSAQAFYGKLRRIPLRLSLGFLEEVTARLLPLRTAHAPAETLPGSLDGLTVVIGDGKTIKGVAKRLRAARGVAGKVHGGKLLVAFLPACGLVTTWTADLDGEVNDAKLVPDLLPRARQRIPGPRLWVLDRQFCDPVQAERLTKEDDHFLVRYHRKVHFIADTQRPVHQTTDERGRVVREEWGWLGAVSNPRRRYVRRITLQRPAAEAIILVTDLLDEERYPAVDLLAVYLKRWRIEQVFQHITEVFQLKRLIGSTAEATVFQASFCLVLYNLIQIVRQLAAEAAPVPCSVASLSAEQIFDDVCEELTALNRVMPARDVVGLFAAEWTVAGLRKHVLERLRQGFTQRWRKAVNAKPRPHTKKPTGRCKHTSIHRLCEAYRQQQKANGGTP
jgi:hypothetical protein